MAHWIDVGGTLGGMTTDIFSEGLQIPILKYQDRGVVNQTLVDIIRMNVRLPSRAMGDLRAQVTAVKTGERRFLQLLDRYGREAGARLRSRRSWISRKSRRARARARSPTASTKPSPSWTMTASISASRCRSGSRSIVKGDEMTIDLTDVSQAGARLLQFRHHRPAIGLRAGRLQMPHVADRLSDQRRRVPQPQGRSCRGPRRQRGAAGADALVDDLSDDRRRHGLQGAGAGDPRPRDRRPSRRSRAPRRSHGINPRTREFFIGDLGPLGGGWGAKQTEDGVSATVCINDGDTHNSPNEQAEAKFPIVVERYALIADSGGAGRLSRRPRRRDAWCARARTMTVNTQIERAHCKPWGLDGGLDATGNQVDAAARRQVEDRSAERQGAGRAAQGRATPSACARAAAAASARRWSGPSTVVAEDVRQGYVSAEAARKLYGVVVDPATFEVDDAATAMLRATMRTAPTPVRRISVRHGMRNDATTIIDFYCHIFPDRFLRGDDRIAPQLGNIGMRLRGVKKLFDLDERFREMDQFGDYRQIISLPNPPIEDIATPENGLELARVGNDAMAELCAKHPDALSGFRRRGLSDRRRRARSTEARRAVNDLGARGVQIFTNIAGKPLDLPEFDPFFAAMADLDVPVWMHPARTAAMTRLHNGGEIALRDVVVLRLAL